MVKTNDRVMHAMLRASIGVALGLAVWLAWSSVQVASGRWKISPRTSPEGTRPLWVKGQTPARSCCLATDPHPWSPALQEDLLPPLRIGQT